MDSRLVMGIAGVVLLTSFMPLTAYSFFNYRLKQKADEYQRILNQLGYTGANAPAYVPAISKEYTSNDYVMPVSFATFMTLLGSLVLVMGPRIVHHPEISLVLLGPKLATIFAKGEPELGVQLQTMLIIAMAFSGAYVWSIQNVFRRLATIDLPPGAYYSVGVRMLFSIFVALILYYLSMPLAPGSGVGTPFTDSGSIPAPLAPGSDILTSLAPTSYANNALPVIAFLAGMFPQRALQYIQERVHFTSQTEKRSDPLPLNMIEGIEIFQRLRLGELGIDNAQNLAQANGIELLLRTPFNPRLIWDWIGQARLYLYFKEDMQKIRKVGVRTIFDFAKLAQDEDRLTMMAMSAEIPIERMKVVAELVHDDADLRTLQEGANKLLGWDAK